MLFQNLVVYKNNLQRIPKRRNEIVRLVGEIEPHLFRNVIESFNYIVNICGGG